MSKKIKILIVDDNKELAQNLSDILSEVNINSVIVYDGNSAIQKCKEEDFQLAILDMKLPDYDGLNLTEELLNINKGLEFIIITGYGTMETAVDAVRQKKIIAYGLNFFLPYLNASSADTHPSEFLSIPF